MKHVAERKIGSIYISNEDFIKAMELEGFEKERFENSPNFFFNVFKQSIPPFA
jgi:hypothetical protein